MSFEVQKVIAITIMTTAIAKWGCSVGDAASRAADCTGFSERVRKWVFAFINTSPMDTTDDPIRVLPHQHFGNLGTK